MSSKIIKGYGLFLLSLFIMGMGISLVTLAHLGTTPITSPPYVLSLSLPISFGMLTMLANFVFVLIEIIVLGKDFPKEQYLQLIVGPILGLSIDFWSYFILYIPQPFYIIQLLMVIIGCAIIAYSTVLQLKANVVNNPAEGVVKAFAFKTSKHFGSIKLYFDISLVVIAVIISFVSLGTIAGVREGTVISALIIGPLIKMFQAQTKKDALSN
ncbi:MAG TPA: DUF6198 family protein [Pseudogracilibacillus sp.]|nr:DUF6198 family protein [Pseudogracilibacillus sp.]